MRFSRRIILGAALIAAATTSGAQGWPSSQVKIVVPFPAGGNADILARTLGQALSERWRQAVVVDNKVGGNTVVAAQSVARAAPDGHTILLAMDTTLTQNQALFRRLPYDPIKDFSPITQAVSSAPAIIVSQRFKGDLKAWVDAARAAPDKANYGVGAVSTQIAGALFEKAAAVHPTAVVYKGSSANAMGLMSGDIDLVVDGVVPYLPYLKDGRARVLATMGSKRSGSLPDAPTLQELGYADFDASIWFGFVAPMATPEHIVRQLNADIVDVLRTPAVKAKLLPLGFDVVGSSPESFARLIASDAQRYGAVIKALGLSME